jgi:phosphoribosylformylglycinamidine synthase
LPSVPLPEILWLKAWVSAHVYLGLIAMALDGNGRYCHLDPYRGAILAVAEASRNVACSGARPLGATNCLNFGNPERPGIMWQFAKAVEGIGAACRALDVPITGGNVSLYNETDGKAIYPTPTIGIVGLLEHADRCLNRMFQGSGDVVLLFGEGTGELGGSEYLKVAYDRVCGLPPSVTGSPLWSRPLASTQLVLTVSPLAMCNAGGCDPMVG